MAVAIREATDRRSRPDGEAALKINRKEKVFVTCVLTKGTQRRLCFSTEQLQGGTYPVLQPLNTPTARQPITADSPLTRTQAAGKTPEEVTLRLSSTGVNRGSAGHQSASPAFAALTFPKWKWFRICMKRRRPTRRLLCRALTGRQRVGRRVLDTEEELRPDGHAGGPQCDCTHCPPTASPFRPHRAGHCSCTVTPRWTRSRWLLIPPPCIRALGLLPPVTTFLTATQ